MKVLSYLGSGWIPERMSMGALCAVLTAALVLLSAPASGELIGVSYQGGLYSINETTGSFVEIAPGVSPPARFNSMGKDAAGLLYSIKGAELYEIDPDVAAITKVLDLSAVVDARGIAVGPDGLLYAIENGGESGDTDVLDELYTIALDTGTVTFVGTTNVTGLQALEFGADGTLYGWDVGTGSGAGLGLVTVDILSAAITDVGPNVMGSSEVQTLAMGPDGTLYGAGHQLFSVDITTGMLTAIGETTVYDVRGMAYVPEPATMVLLGLGGLGLLRRRQS